VSTISLGKNLLSGKKLSIPLTRLFSTHTHVLGSSGVGKSKLLESIARDIIAAAYGLILLDGKGDLYDNLLNWCARMNFPPYKLRLIDPRDSYAPGLNILKPLGNTNNNTQADLVISMLQKMRGKEDSGLWLDEWGGAALRALILAGMSITEVEAFTRLDDPRFRLAVLSAIGQ